MSANEPPPSHDDAPSASDLDLASLVEVLAAGREAETTLLREIGKRLHARARSNGDELVTRKSWRGPGSFGALLDAARRGEIERLYAGRTPCFRRRDLDRWMAERGAKRAPKLDAKREPEGADDYAIAVRTMGGEQ